MTGAQPRASSGPLSRLFAPGRIGDVHLANRLVRSATIDCMVRDGRHLPEAVFALYRRLARGGVGLITAGNYFVHDSGRAQPGLVIDTDACVLEMARLTAAVHAHGAVLFAQLNHGGRQAATELIGRRPLAPSAVRDTVSRVKPRAMTEGEVETIIRAYIDGARRIRDAGFDGVQINGAHGYLVNQFLSPRTNRRRDRFGGSLRNRARFLMEIYEGIRAVVGDDYPVTVKLNSSDNVRGGVTLGEFLEVAVLLDQAGVDAIEVSGGVAESGLTTTRGGVPMDLVMHGRPLLSRGVVRLLERRLRRACRFQEGYHLDAAAALKRQIRAPVIAVGGMRSRSGLEAALASGAADFVAMSRPFILQPDLARRMHAQPDFEVACSSCNRCTLATVVHHMPLACARLRKLTHLTEVP